MRFPGGKHVVSFAVWMEQRPRSAAEQQLFWSSLSAVLRLYADAPVCAEDRATLASKSKAELEPVYHAKA